MATTGSPRWPAALADGSTCGHRPLSPRAARSRTRRAVRQGRRDRVELGPDHERCSGKLTRPCHVPPAVGQFRGGVADRHHDGFSTSDISSHPCFASLRVQRRHRRPPGGRSPTLETRSHATSWGQQRVGSQCGVLVVAGQHLGVHLQGDSDVSVTDALRHDLHRYAARERTSHPRRHEPQQRTRTGVVPDASSCEDQILGR